MRRKVMRFEVVDEDEWQARLNEMLFQDSACRNLCKKTWPHSSPEDGRALLAFREFREIASSEDRTLRSQPIYKQLHRLAVEVQPVGLEVR